MGCGVSILEYWDDTQMVLLCYVKLWRVKVFIATCFESEA